MTEMREMRHDGSRRDAPSGVRYSRLEGTDDIIRIKIKTLDNESTWEVESEGSWTVRQLKDHLKETKDLKEKRIRLILLGRMLEDSHTLSSYGMKDGDFVHAAISEEEDASLVEEDASIARCSSRDVAASGDVRVDINNRDEEEGPRGFDRLLRAGFSQTEVDILRTQFHSRRHSSRPMSEDESLELEDEWLEQNQGGDAPISLAATSRDAARRLDRVMDEVSEGTQADMLLGLVMGFVFGIIMLFWIWERGIPRRQKLGILCGIACNLTMGMIRLQARTHARVAHGGRADVAGAHHNL